MRRVRIIWRPASTRHALAVRGLPTGVPGSGRGHAAVLLVDGPRVLEAISPHGILDDGLFHDAQHPNLRGYVASPRICSTNSTNGVPSAGRETWRPPFLTPKSVPATSGSTRPDGRRSAVANPRSIKSPRIFDTTRSSGTGEQPLMDAPPRRSRPAGHPLMLGFPAACCPQARIAARVIPPLSAEAGDR